MSEETVQSRLRAERGMADLYRRYAPWLIARMRGRFGAEAEDIVQDAWVRVAALGHDNLIQHPKAFLLRIAQNLALDRVRHRQVAARHAATRAEDDSLSPDQLEAVLLEQVIDGLPAPLRDRIVVGEMRDGAAALETLKSWNTGHPGGLSTIHANSAGDVVRRLEGLLDEVTARTPSRLVGDSVDLIVHIHRVAAGRRVEEILRVEPGRDGAVSTRPAI